MQSPANFDSLILDGLLMDWIRALKPYAVEALVVLGPAVTGSMRERWVHAVYPPRLVDAAVALAASEDFGYDWQTSDSPMVAWQTISRGAYGDLGRWRLLALGHGLQSVVRVEFALPRGRAFECFLFTPQAMHERAEAAALVWSTLNIWPKIKRVIAEVTCPLSRREKECLALAFDGQTAFETAKTLECSERTVTYHLANAMRKLKVDNKLQAIERASWYGVI
jgi:LuxR family transcriptional regulator, quorum-sensing system regulator SolR